MTARTGALLKQIKPIGNATLNYTIADIAAVVAPTLVIMGDRDGLVRLEEGVEMFCHLPNAEFTVIPNAEHGDFIFSPAKIALLQPILLDFLRRNRRWSLREILLSLVKSFPLRSL